jgi:hypothetical protein
MMIYRNLGLVLLLAVFAAACDQNQSLLTAPDAAFNEIGDTGELIGSTNDVTPSTNAQNEENGWAHVLWNSDDAGVGEAPLKFVSTRGFLSCFEFRIDDAETTDPRDNFNTDINDGLWPFQCVSDEAVEETFMAESHVDIRMVFGAETDERFDWTRFYVLTPMTKEDCRDGMWQEEGFRNQGQCIRYVETGKDSR